jgi:hypothetical protein
MQKDIFDFPVERVPMYVPFKGEKLKAEKDAIVRADTKDIIGYVSAAQVERKTADGTKKVVVDRDYYKVITHTELVQEARDAVRSLGLKAKETTYLLQNGGRMFHDFVFPDEAIEPAKGDFITMKLTLVNSYDTSRPIGFELGGLRQVCTNGLVAFRKAFFEMRKHSGGYDLDLTVKNMKKAVETFQMQMLGFYKLMGKTPLDVAIGVAIIKDMVEKKTMPEKYGEAVQAVWENPEMANSVIPATDVTGKVIPGQFERVMADPRLDQARTVWAFYNAFTLILTHYIASVERRMLIHQAIQGKIAQLVSPK